MREGLVEQVLTSVTHDLGGFKVHRLLPARDRRPHRLCQPFGEETPTRRRILAQIERAHHGQAGPAMPRSQRDMAVAARLHIGQRLQAGRC